MSSLVASHPPQVSKLHHLLIILFLRCYLLDVELIKNNAALGAQIAISLSNMQSESQVNKVMTASTPALARGRKITVVGGAAIDIISKS